jgi:hypothetical protein
MYGDVVRRTQIYLDDEETKLLADAAARTGASRSELIRRAVRTLYRAQTPESRLVALHASAGVWRDRVGTGADYVDDMREDLNERLARFRLPGSCSTPRHGGSPRREPRHDQPAALPDVPRPPTAYPYELPGSSD